MSSFFGNIYENVASNYVATALSNGLSSITSAVVDNFGTVAFFGIGIISGLGRISGQAVSKFTGKLTGTYVQLNSFVPFFVRKKLQIVWRTKAR